MNQLYFCLFLATLLISCSIQEPQKPNNSAPIILSVFVPTKISTNDEIITARVIDFDGIEDIDSIWVNVAGPLGFAKSRRLLDNGVTPDAVAQDSIFSANLTSSFFAPLDSADFDLSFFAIDKSGNVSNQVNHTVKLNTRPAILQGRREH